MLRRKFLNPGVPGCHSIMHRQQLEQGRFDIAA